VNNFVNSDRERILLKILHQMRFTSLLGPKGQVWSSEPFKEYVHFAPWDAPKKGDLVIATSGGSSRWAVGFVHEVHNDNHLMIREIGTDAVCDYSNESFTPVKNMAYTDLLEGERYKIYQKVLQAFRKGDEYLYCYGGVIVDEDTITVRIRERYGGFGGDSNPFSITIPWNKRTSVKTILMKMREGGYGTKSFKTPNTEQTP
jgi:hypothetical protein